MCPTSHKIQSDDSLHIPDDSHGLNQTSIIPHFSDTMNFSFCGNYQTLKLFNTKYRNDLLGLFVLLENPNQSLRNAFFSTFSHPACETGCKNATHLQFLFRTFCHHNRIDFYSLYSLSDVFVYFARVNFYSFSLPLSVRGWLRLVIAAFPGLFFYLCFITHNMFLRL